MLEADREFEFEFEDNGVPGVILPKRTIVRGIMSVSAEKRFLSQVRRLNETQKNDIIRKAFERRFRINGAVAGRIELRPSDISAALCATNVMPPPV